MIKKSDIVICILKEYDWKPAKSCINAHRPKYNEQCIIESVYYVEAEKSYYVDIIGYDYSYRLDSFRKIQDNFASNLLKQIGLEIVIQEQVDYLERLYK